MKILVIRFSAFGDIVQCMSILDDICQKFPNAQIHWVTRREFIELVGAHAGVHKVHGFDRQKGLKTLVKMGLQLRSIGFDYIYDAHSNLRSRVLKCLLKPFPWSGPKLVTRPKERLKRLLLFHFGIDLYPMPYRGMLSYRTPLVKWGWMENDLRAQQWKLPRVEVSCDEIALCPSAAWEMKRWPFEHWKKLIELLPECRFVVLGGPADKFCQELEVLAPDRVRNLAGRLSLIESCAAISQAAAVVCADTGLIHVADLLGVKGLSLIGPTAFGFPTRSNIKTLEVELDCRPCSKDGRGKCSQAVWQKCMVEIRPERVAQELKQL